MILNKKIRRSNQITFLLSFSLIFFISCGKNENGNTYQSQEQKTYVPGPEYGTGWEETPFTYNIQKPWNVSVGERYKYDKNTDEHTFWISRDDEPFKQGDHTSPRCEMRILNDYTEGDHQFMAEFFVNSGSHQPVVMQVFGYPVAFNLKATNTLHSNGSFIYDKRETTSLMDDIYDKWVHVNIVHSIKLNTIFVFLNGKQVGAYANKTPAESYYFKCGVYTCRSEKSAVKIRNIKYYTR